MRSGQTLSAQAHALQNVMAMLLFASLLAFHGAIYLLYLYPGAELLWRVVLPVNRIFGPVLLTFDFGFGRGPFAAFAVLSGLAAVPAVAYVRRSWLGTAVAGHTALAFFVVMTLGTMIRPSEISASASLGPISDAALPQSPPALILAALTAAMIFLCALNHVAFFRGSR